MLTLQAMRTYPFLIILQITTILAFPVLAMKNAHAETPQAQRIATAPPDITMGPLFEAVQKSKMFPDQKTFVDAVPRYSPSAIMADYYMQRRLNNFDLQHFVLHNFTIPADGKGYIPPGGQTLREHIIDLWPHLTRSTPDMTRWDSLLPLPNAYVVPGGRFREVYYWDSYFTMLGLAESDQWGLIRNMVQNFAYQIDRYGHIPNSNRTYYLSRSQPPFFTKMVELLAKHDGDNLLVTYLPQMKREYQYWMDGENSLQPGQADKRVVRLDDDVLNRYWDDRNVPRTESWLDDVTTASQVPESERPQLYRDLRAGAASGWDFSSRWLKDPMKLSTIHTTDILPVDLNALLYHNEMVLSKASRLANKMADADRYALRADKRKQALNLYFWNAEKRYYADYDWRQGKVSQQLTAATLFPLYVQAAPLNYAQETAQAVRNELVQEGGMVTTTLHSHQQWDAPNAWAPLQWVAVEGLRYYQQEPLAEEIAVRFLNSVRHTYEREHKLVEKYAVETGELGGGGGGEYELQDGFGWTNGVTLKLLSLYPPQQDQDD
ncbi:alpha,alpha-trehalase TreA [Lonsdalea quercina]|uniref:alpha,alpha-trehalase TreA n=1 Tax=Lonsdalea quercina TaxID=71657 RepID=UPI0039770664